MELKPELLRGMLYSLHRRLQAGFCGRKETTGEKSF